MSNDNIIEILIKELTDNRNDMKKMILDLEELKNKIDKLFPDKLDIRYMKFFEEKLKSATSLFNTILDIRKEVAKSLKDEIDIRRKYIDNNDDDNIDEQQIRKLANFAEALRKKDEIKKNEEKSKLLDLTIRNSNDEKVEVK